MKDYRADLERIFKSAVEYADAEHLVHGAVMKDGDSLVINSEYFSNFQKVFMFAFGKAACGMAKGFMSVCDVAKGVIVSNKIEKFPKNIKVIKGGHPLPDEGSVEGAKAVMELAREADAETLCVFLVSGGGSSMLSATAFGITLQEQVEAFDLLVKCGADIEDINIVRRHISEIKGGKLAEIASPAQCVTLAISDVVTGSPEAIASGPTYTDPSTWADTAEVVERFNLFNKLPPKVAQVIRDGEAGLLPETIKKDRSNYKYHILASNLGGLQKAAETAGILGYIVRVYGQLDCSATGAAEIMAARVSENLINASDSPVCMIFGGEVTVNVTGKGKGGRCQQVALEFLLQDKPADTFALFAATDGMDGTTDAAGAFADNSISKDGAEDAMLNNDAYNFFDRNESLLITGKTGTNINDIYLVIIPQFESSVLSKAEAEASFYY